MIKIELLHSELLTLLSRLGHTQKICICDAGLPIPMDAHCIDLAITKNMPEITFILELIHKYLVIEEGIAALETKDHNPNFLNFMNQAPYPISYLSHEDFKKLSKDCIAFIRTGECTPYANIILSAGVPF
jgi:D-ribose pyranase